MRHIKERNFIIILSLLVGIVTGLAGVFLKNSVHLTHQFFTERLQIDSGSLLFLSILLLVSGSLPYLCVILSGRISAMGLLRCCMLSRDKTA